MTAAQVPADERPPMVELEMPCDDLQLPELREGTEEGDVIAFLRLLAQIARRQATRSQATRSQPLTRD